MDSHNRITVITGGSDGIGAAAARRLSSEGREVVLVGRSEAKTSSVAKEIGAPYHLADFSELSQVRRLAAELQDSYPRIDVLANNAGGIMGDRRMTADGFEFTFQVNHLAPFLLTHLLMPTLISSKAKVLQTSSTAAGNFGNIDIDDLDNARDYSPEKAYGDAKLENILFTKELHRRFGDQGISAAAFHPGIVATSFANDTTHYMRFIYHTPLKYVFTINADKGARPLTWLIDGTPGRTWQSGEYYEKNRVAKSTDQADDRELARQLWERSADMLKL